MYSYIYYVFICLLTFVSIQYSRVGFRRFGDFGSSWLYSHGSQLVYIYIYMCVCVSLKMRWLPQAKPHQPISDL